MKVSKNLRFTQHTGFIFMGLSNYFKHPSSKLCPSIGNKCPFSLAVNRRIGCDYSSSTARSYSNFRFDFHANNIVYESSERTLDKCKNILALDFDGVVCASAEESSSTAVLTAKEIWKYNYSNMPTDSQTTDTKVIEILKALRPIIETGYESVLLARRIHEILAEKQGNNIFDNKGVIEEIVSLWSPSFRDSLISEYKSSKDALIDAFGSMRDRLIVNNITAWVGMNKVYPNVLESFRRIHNMRRAENRQQVLPYYIITTKQERYVRAIMTSPHNAPYACPSKSCIFDLENAYGPKAKVLQYLTMRHSLKSDDEKAIHFVEDRYETLLNIANIPELDHIKLYLVDWGYNTPEHRAEASQHKRIKLIDGIEFNKLARMCMASE